MRRWLLAVLLAGPAVARAQDDLTVLKPDGDVPPRRMLHAYLIAEAQKHFDARRTAVEALKSPDDVRKRQSELRAKFIEALGGFPEKTPLNAKVVGTQQRDGYRIEKVVYESRPDHHVTATLYLPDGKGPFPGVLMPIGHSANGKAADYVQRGSILLAKNGLAVLAYDPIGQGERRQLLDPPGKPAIPSSTNEHTLAGIGALLVGRNTASYRVWDGIRSLDYLAGRPEIDPTRLGCTGCSGGGTLTSYLMALDDRIVCAAPSCYVTSLERLFATIGPQDAEQNVTGQVAFGMEHADYLALHAPQPTLICAATRDFFDIRGTWTTFREAKRVYGVLGHPERVDLVEFDTTHGYPKPQREAVARWMRRWLLKVDDAPVEGDFAIAKDADLACTKTGQVLEDLKGKSVFDLNREEARRLAEKRAANPLTGEALLKEVARLIGVKLPVPAVKPVEVGVVKRDGYRIRKLTFETEPGITVPALLFEKGANDRSPLAVLVHEKGKAAVAKPNQAIDLLAKGGCRVLAVDVRGTGETAPGEAPKGRPGFFGVDFKETYLALHVGRPLLGQRVYDLLSVIGWAAGESPGITLFGFGSAAPVALHAAALDRRVHELQLYFSIGSWTDVASTPITYNQITNVVPGALKVYDLPDLTASLAPRKFEVGSRVDPAGGLLLDDAAAKIEVKETDEFVQIDTDAIQARVRKKGYVSGVEAASLLDRKTGAREVGFGLHIMDFLLAPGWRDDGYTRDRKLHGDLPKHYVEGPQICTQAKELKPEIVKGDGFVAVVLRYTFHKPGAGYKAGSTWEQTLVFRPGVRYVLSAERITSVNAADNLFYRIDMPGHVKHASGDTFSQVYLSYLDKPVPAEAFRDDFAPDAKYLYQRQGDKVPSRMIRAYQVKRDGKPGPWLAGMTLDPAAVSEAWCHQRGYICFIQELHGRAVKAGESFGAAYVVGWFDDVAEMETVYDQYKGKRRLVLEAGRYRLE